MAALALALKDRPCAWLRDYADDLRDVMQDAGDDVVYPPFAAH